MKSLRRIGFAALLILFSAASAKAQWQTAAFDLTKKDTQAYTTDLPAEAFTPDGLKIALKGDTTYTLMSKQIYGGDFSFELQQSISNRSKAGTITVEMVLVNDAKHRKAVGTYSSFSAKVGDERADVQYFKDGKASGFMAKNSWCDRSTSSDRGREDNSYMEWLRIQKMDQKIWFMQKYNTDAYHWGGLSNYPETTYFGEDCDSFAVSLVIHCSADASGVLQIKTLRISGTNVLPRDTKKREFHFDFGPVNQELEDDFDPVSEYTMYTPEKGMGWVIPEMEKVVRNQGGIPALSDAQIAAAHLQPINKEWPGWAQNDIRESYWMELNDKKLFYSGSHGKDFVESLHEWLDLKTPLERDFVGMAKSYHFSRDDLYDRDCEERRGSIYIDDDLSAEFVVDLPNGQYNLIIGEGYTPSGFTGEASDFNVEVQGRVRKQGVRPDWRRCNQYPIRGVDVENGQMRIRFFCDTRRAMDNYLNHNIGTGWMISYLLILPAENKELMNQWEWKIIKERGDIIRRMAFVKGDPAVTRSEGRLPATQPAVAQGQTDHGQTGFITLNGKPFYYLVLQNNYHPGVTNHYNYYCLDNTLHFSDGMQASKQFFKPDWEKLSYSDDYPWRLIDQLNTSYKWQCLATLAHNDILSFVPQAVMGEGNPTVDSRGRRNRYNLQPPLNSPLGKEIQKEAFTMMSNQIGTHPAVASHYIYEELWHPEEQGYDDQSLLQFWQWLQNKYGTIEALNKDWNSQYAQWEDIAAPVQGKNEFWQYTPVYVNFREFRGWAQRQMILSACNLVRKNEPNHFTWGAKGDFGTQSWYPAEFLDDFGWYTPQAAVSAARYFGKTAICSGYRLDNEWAYTDGRRQFDQKPGPHKSVGHAEENLYNRLIWMVFEGTKGFWNEWYSDGFCDAFMRTDLIRRDAPKYKIKEWTGQIGFFEPPAFEGPSVKLARHALFADRANQMLYRLGQLWLPAAPMEPRVLVPTTQESFFLPFFGPKPYADFEPEAMRILKSSNLPVDFMAMSAVKDLSRYQLIIIGDTTQAISKADARRIRDYVAQGGKLIIMDGGGFADEAHPRRYWGEKDQVYPLEEFADLGGYTLEAKDPWSVYENTAVRFLKNDVDPDIADGTALGRYTVYCYYVPREGSQVFLKGHLEKEDQDVALGILSAKHNVAVVNFPPKGSGDELVHPLALWFRKLIESWKIDGRITLGGVDDAWDVYGGCLKGSDYTLAAVCNQSPDKPRTLSMQLNFLPEGEYAVIDVTGEHPDLLNRPDGSVTLKDDQAARLLKIDYRLSAKQLAQQGIPCHVPPMQAQVFLIRPLQNKVWVSIWRPWLDWFVRHPITIAYGTDPSDKAGAEEIRQALTQIGVQATLLPAADVKWKKLHHEVRIDPFKREALPHDNPSTWFLVDTFDNEVVDSTDNFIAVGSLQSNAVLSRWTAVGSFVYDKVLEKVTPQYPGPGRGVIGAVDSIDSAIFNPQSQSRDGIVVGGSDAVGTQNAVREFTSLITRYCTTPHTATTKPVKQ